MLRRTGQLPAQSLSARRAWIEILAVRPGVDPGGVALRKESVDRNSGLVRLPFHRTSSLSARRAWIEIQRAALSCALAAVALRKESVDRNHRSIVLYHLRAGVALRKESVDRNDDFAGNELLAPRSLSARRAWIEIRCWAPRTPGRNRRSPQGERG